MVVNDPLTVEEERLIPELTERQRELLKNAVAGGGVIYRARKDEQANPLIRFGLGKTTYPPATRPDPAIFEAYNAELSALLEMRIISRCGSDAFFLSWSGWRIARALIATEQQ